MSRASPTIRGSTAVQKLAAAEGSQVVAVCAAIEAEISQLDEADRAEFLAELKLDEPGLNRVIRAAFKLLGLQTYFTAGLKEVRAWTVRAGVDRAAGGRRHSHGFRARLHPGRGHRLLRITSPSAARAGAREVGKLRLEGKEYVVREGDVMHFRFNV